MQYDLMSDSHDEGYARGLEEAAVICEELAMGSKLIAQERFILMRAAELIRQRLPSHNGGAHSP